MLPLFGTRSAAMKCKDGSKIRSDGNSYSFKFDSQKVTASPSFSKREPVGSFGTRVVAGESYDRNVFETVHRSGRSNCFSLSLLRVIQEERCDLLVPPI